MSDSFTDWLLEQMNTLMSQRNWAEALQKGGTLLKMLPANDLAKRAVLCNNMGKIHNERAEYRFAEAYYGEAVRVDPTDSDSTWYNRANNQYHWGKSLERSGISTESRRHFQLAMDYVRKAESINPHDGDIRNLIEIIQRSM